jgi:hypothetical protein
MSNTLSKDERDVRVAVWVELSDLFLDTELGALDWWSIAEVLAASPYSARKLEQIYSDEVAPVLVHNLLAPIGVWSGFDQEWLAQTLRAKDKPLYTFPILGPMMKKFYTSGTSEDFSRVMKRVDLLRRDEKPSAIVTQKLPADGPMLLFVACRLSGFDEVRNLFTQEDGQGAFLDAAARPEEISETIQVDDLTIGGIKIAVTEKEIYIEQVQILPPYFLDKLSDVLAALVARYEETNLPIRLTLLNIEQFRAVPEKFGFHIVEDDGTEARRFVSYVLHR